MKTIDLYFYELARVNVVDLCVNMSKGKRREAKLAKKAAKAEKVLENYSYRSLNVDFPVLASGEIYRKE